MKRQPKGKLVQSLKKLVKDPRVDDRVLLRAQRQPSKKSDLESGLVNKSYDTPAPNSDTVLPQIDRKRHQPKRSAHSIVPPMRNAAGAENLARENEALRSQNRELERRLGELERVCAAAGSREKTGKLLFDYERKLASLSLSLQAAQLRLQENDRLITQLLQTIDYLNQETRQSLPKPQKKAAHEPAGKKAPDTDTKDEESDTGEFLYDKSELVQSHNQIKQTKYMIFEGFKTLQSEIAEKYGDQGKVLGTVDYLLGSLDTLFNIFHQLEIKELQYLNALTHTQPDEGKHEVETKARK